MKHYRYAHRGLHDLTQGVPENSLAAFRRAAEAGFPSELDVHLLSDGSLAVFHDSDLLRMTGKEGTLEQLTAEQLKLCTLGGTGETIPEFREVLALYSGTGLPLLVELKSHHNNHALLAERAVAELDRFHVPYSIESFDPRCLLWLLRNRPEIVRGQLAQDFLRTPSGLGHTADRILTRMSFNKRTHPDFVAFNFAHRDTPSLRRVRNAHRAEIFYWTIRSRAELEEAEREGAQAIFEGFVP